MATKTTVKDEPRWKWYDTFVKVLDQTKSNEKKNTKKQVSEVIEEKTQEYEGNLKKVHKETIKEYFD
jgi:hypothetical protein